MKFFIKRRPLSEVRHAVQMLQLSLGNILWNFGSMTLVEEPEDKKTPWEDNMTTEPKKMRSDNFQIRGVWSCKGDIAQCLQDSRRVGGGGGVFLWLLITVILFFGAPRMKTGEVRASELGLSGIFSWCCSVCPDIRCLEKLKYLPTNFPVSFGSKTIL